MLEEADYPAAHSMDTTWWAVDRYGQVGRFYSGERGPVPEQVQPQEHRVEDLEQPLPETSSLRWFRGDSTEPHLGPPKLDEDAPDHQDEWKPPRFFAYGLSTGAWPYRRRLTPEGPWRLAQANAPEQPLSAAHQQELARRGWVAFPDLDFQREMLIQPLEHMPCALWDDQGWVSTTGSVSLADFDENDKTPCSLSLKVEPDDPTPVRLAIAYLQGEADAASVLGDWLKERGRPAVWPAETPSGRLDELLWSWFDPEERANLEHTMVEHLLDRLEGKSPEQVADLREMLMYRLNPAQVLESAHDALYRWAQEEGEEHEPIARAAWAVWALLQEIPLIPSRTARAVQPDELSWQIAKLLEQMGRRAPG